MASDRYFSEKALLYDWKATDEQHIRSGWYGLIAPAFVPNSPNKRMDAGIIRNWVAQFVALHRRISGPLPTCTSCTSKCNFQYEVSEITRDSKIRSDFRGSLNRETASSSDSAAWFCHLLSERMIGKKSIDLEYCLAIHLIEGLDVPVAATTALSTDAQLVFAHKVRSSLTAQESNKSHAL
ncbi:MAG TPA: hypothetical protein V6C97_18820 [Oculatellaceae cyanobacterium]